eukprot:TRINITY_DN464_c0_g2_i2.p1 TRINITY_DN464_c0_g2~~TRINITY_DN464_c0_g2_i2.p1  ORF type:complete len:1134 (-),score=397.84 TRINITY_DN464_c0_g2_i2:88-3288(-)
MAIKIITLEKGECFDDLVIELDVLKHCNHPNVVGYFNSWAKNNELFIGLELCDGGSTTDIYLGLAQTFAEDVIAYVCRETLVGLKYMHENGYVHRDIKGANILLNKKGAVKIIDFGVSGKISADHPKRSTFIGTPYWMAPEVIENKRVPTPYDEKSDIWSFGITMLELAQGDPPLGDLHPMKALLQIPYRPPPTLDNPSRWSAEFSDFLSCCLKLEPDLRHSAAELLVHPFLKKACDKTAVIQLVLKYDKWRQSLEASEQAEVMEASNEEEEKAKSILMQVQEQNAELAAAAAEAAKALPQLTQNSPTPERAATAPASPPVQAAPHPQAPPSPLVPPAVHSPPPQSLSPQPSQGVSGRWEFSKSKKGVSSSGSGLLSQRRTTSAVGLTLAVTDPLLSPSPQQREQEKQQEQQKEQKEQEQQQAAQRQARPKTVQAKTVEKRVEALRNNINRNVVHQQLAEIKQIQRRQQQELDTLEAKQSVEKRKTGRTFSDKQEKEVQRIQAERDQLEQRLKVEKDSLLKKQQSEVDALSKQSAAAMRLCQRAKETSEQLEEEKRKNEALQQLMATLDVSDAKQTKKEKQKIMKELRSRLKLTSKCALPRCCLRTSGYYAPVIELSNGVVTRCIDALEHLDARVAKHRQEEIALVVQNRFAIRKLQDNNRQQLACDDKMRKLELDQLQAQHDSTLQELEHLQSQEFDALVFMHDLNFDLTCKKQEQAKQMLEGTQIVLRTQLVTRLQVEMDQHKRTQELDSKELFKKQHQMALEAKKEFDASLRSEQRETGKKLAKEVLSERKQQFATSLAETEKEEKEEQQRRYEEEDDALNLSREKQMNKLAAEHRKALQALLQQHKEAIAELEQVQAKEKQTLIDGQCEKRVALVRAQQLDYENAVNAGLEERGKQLRLFHETESSSLLDCHAEVILQMTLDQNEQLSMLLDVQREAKLPSSTPGTPPPRQVAGEDVAQWYREQQAAQQAEQKAALERVSRLQADDEATDSETHKREEEENAQAADVVAARLREDHEKMLTRVTQISAEFSAKLDDSRKHASVAVACVAGDAVAGPAALPAT